MTYFEQVGTERIKDDAVTAAKIDSTSVADLTTVQTFTATKAFQRANPTDVATVWNVTGEGQNRATILANGKLSVGDGSSSPDVTFERSGFSTWRFTSDAFQILNRPGTAGGTARIRSFQASDTSILSDIEGETGTRYLRRADGQTNWGDGTAATDTNLYRSGVGELTTDTALVVGTDLNVNGNVALGDAITDLIGLYGAAAVAQAAAIASPAVQTAAYVQADVQSIADAVDDIRTALTAIGITA